MQNVKFWLIFDLQYYYNNIFLGIISRVSRAGKLLGPDGYKEGGDEFGLMQVSRHFCPSLGIVAK